MALGRLVVDTNVLLSALHFHTVSLSWLRAAWREERLRPLVSRWTAAELIRVLAYPKFRLSEDDQKHLLDDYLPWCETVVVPDPPPEVPRCRDPSDRPFLELAVASRADALVTGDGDLLVLAAGFSVPILTRPRPGTKSSGPEGGERTDGGSRLHDAGLHPSGCGPDFRVERHGNRATGIGKYGRRHADAPCRRVAATAVMRASDARRFLGERRGINVGVGLRGRLVTISLALVAGAGPVHHVAMTTATVPAPGWCDRPEAPGGSYAVNEDEFLPVQRPSPKT